MWYYCFRQAQNANAAKSTHFIHFAWSIKSFFPVFTHYRLIPIKSGTLRPISKARRRETIVLEQCKGMCSCPASLSLTGQRTRDGSTAPAWPEPAENNWTPFIQTFDKQTGPLQQTSKGTVSWDGHSLWCNFFSRPLGLVYCTPWSLLQRLQYISSV